MGGRREGAGVRAVMGAITEGLPRPLWRFAGYALPLCWMLTVGLGGLFDEVEAPGQSDVLLAMAAGAALGSVALLLVVLRCVPLSRHRPFCFGAASVAAAGSAAAVLAAAGALPSWVVFGGVAIAAAAMAWVVLAWQEYLATQGVRAAALAMAMATALGALLFAGVRMLPDPAGSVAVVAMPLAAVAAFCPQKGVRFYVGSGAVGPLTTRQLLGNIARDYSLRLFVLCGLAVFAFDSGCLAVVLGHGIGGGAELAVFAAGGAIAALGACAAVAFVRPSQMLRLFYVAFPLLMVSSCLALAGGVLARALSFFAGTAGVALMYYLVWALMVDVAHRKRLPSLGLLASLAAACFAGLMADRLLALLPGLPTNWLVADALVALGVGSLLFASFNGRVSVSDEVFSVPVPDGREERLQALAERCSLTSRETEIVRLWLTGHNAAYIEGELHISRNTVKTHLNHIYQKTGTSNREGLLALLEP